MQDTELIRQALQVLRGSQAPIGFHVREQWLANALGVSRSPARRVLQRLETMGLVKSEPNQGFHLCTPADQLNVPTGELPESEIERIYRRIIQERFANLLGDHISVGELVQRYDTNRSVVSKVLARMQEHGLLERTAGHAWVFGPALINEEALEENFRFRILLEPAAILEPKFSIPAKRLKALISLHEHYSGEAIYGVELANLFEMDADFHNTIAECSGNRFIAQAIRQQTHLRRLSEFETFYDKALIQDSLKEHLVVLRAIEQGDLPSASAALEAHIRASLDCIPDMRKLRVLAHRRLTRR